MTYLYDVMGRPDCTDPITRLSVQEFLEPAKDIEYAIYAVLLILFVLTVVSTYLIIFIFNGYHCVCEFSGWYSYSCLSLFSGIMTMFRNPMRGLYGRIRFLLCPYERWQGIDIRICNLLSIILFRRLCLLL